MIRFGIVLLTAVVLFAVWLRLSQKTFAQNTDTQSQASPSPLSSPSPSPSPTPITGLHQWGAVTLFHGLPSDRVHAISQADDGTMWFGTESGLARFDGRRIQTVNDPGLTSGRILSLQKDQEGALWVGTDSGAFRFKDGRFDQLKETAGYTIASVISPHAGFVLFASEQGQVFESVRTSNSTPGESNPAPQFQTRALLKQPLETTDRDHPGPLPITSLSWTNNVVLAGTLSRGLVEIENGTAKEPAARPSTYFIYALEKLGDELWVGTKTKKDEPGAFVGNTVGSLKRNEAPTGTALSLRTIGSDIWIGTDGHGVFRISKSKTQHFTFDGTAGGLRSDHVYAIFEDREGIIWFGTDRGVCRYDPHAPRVESLGDSSDSNFVRSLYQLKNGQIFAGTNRGLFVSTSAGAWTPIAELGRNIIYSVSEDKTGRLLVASASGFFVSARAVVDADTSFTRVESASGSADANGSVRAIVDFQGATYFAVFGRGIERMGPPRASLSWPADANNSREVVSLLSDGDSRILIGTTRDGVLTSDGKTITADPYFASLKGLVVRAMARSDDGTLWFGTPNGVHVCKVGGSCSLIVPNVDVRYLISNSTQSGSEILCGTRGNGLLKIRDDSIVGPIVAELDSEQGLPSQSVFAALVVSNGASQSFLIGTNRGIARYEPGTVPPTLFVSRVLSRRVHSPSELQNGLYLEYPQNGLLVDVTAVSSRTYPEQFQYAFTLADNAGQIVKQKLSRESQFTLEGLKPGKYTVSARGFTKDLVASTPLSFSLTVAKAPFPWTSTALAILLALALLALLWAILERRRIVATSAALFTANRELADARLNLANEAERERRRIARDLHDQTLADLRHLALMTDQIKGNGNAERTTQSHDLRSEIESISQEVRRICEDLSPSVLQNVGFAAALEFALSHVGGDPKQEGKLDYEFVCDDSLDERAHLTPGEQMQIYRIVQEAVNNIWRHAHASTLKMYASASAGGDFHLRLEDDGQPFEKDHRNVSGRGLANMRARAALIDARIEWSKRSGGGTIFTLNRKAPTAEGRSLETFTPSE